MQMETEEGTQVETTAQAPTEKRCSKCERTLPVSEFRGDPRLADGLRSQCKQCQRKTSTESWRRRCGKGTGTGGYDRTKPPPQKPAPTSGPPSCPECRSTEVCALNKRAGMQLYQCGKCLEGFELPLPPSDPLARIERQPPEDLRSSEPCAKGCGEEFRYPPEKKRHEILCLGRRKDSGPRPMEETVAKEKCWCGRDGGHTGRHRGGKAKGAQAKQTKVAAPKGAVGGVLDIALAQLRAKRTEILAGIPELQEVDRAIAALEALESRPTAGK